MNVRKTWIYFVVLVLCGLSETGFSATYYNKASGTGALQLTSNWGTNTDGTGTAPGGFTFGNTYNLVNGSTGTITGTWTMGGSLVIGNGTAAFNLTIPSTSALTGSGITLTNNATLTWKNTTTLPTFTSINSGSTINYAGTGSQTIAALGYGNLAISGPRTGTITLASGTISVAGTCTDTASGTITYVNTGNTFTYSSTTGGQLIENAIPYNNLQLSNTSGTDTAGGNITVAGTLTTTFGVLDMTTYTLSVTGTITSTGTIKTQSTSATPLSTGKTWNRVYYDALTGGQTIVAGTYDTLLLGNTSGTSTAAGALTVNTGLITTAGGILDVGTNTISGGFTNILNNGEIQTDNTSTTPIPTGKTWGGTGTINYSLSTGGQTIVVGTYTCGLKQSNTSGTNTAAGILTINGNLTTTAGGTLSMSTFAIAGTPGTVSNGGTITTSSTSTNPMPAGEDWSGGGTGAVVFAVTTGAQSVPAGTYNDLTFSNTSGTNTAVGDLVVNGTLTTTSGGTFAMAINQLSGTTSPVNNGTITTNSTDNPALSPNADWTGTTGAVTFAATTGGQFVPAGTYKTLKFSNTSGTNTAVGDLSVTTSMTVGGAGGTLDMGTYAIGGSLTTLTLTTTTTLKTANLSAHPIPSGTAGLTLSGTIIFSSLTGGQTVPLETQFRNLTFSNTSGTNTAAAAVKVVRALTTTAGGTLDMTAANRITGGTNSSYVNNGIIKTGVPTSVSSTPIPSAKTWTGSGTIEYTATSGSQTIVAGTFSCKITMDNSSGTNTAGGNITLNNTLTTTSGGTFNLNTRTLSGTVTPANNGTISTTSTSTTPFPSGKNWTGTTGSVIFARAAGTQTIPAGTYGTLKLSNTSGTNTAAGALNVTTALITTSGGTMAMSTFQLLGAFAATHNGALTTSNTTNPAIPAGKDWTGTTGSVTYSVTTGGQFVPAGTYNTLGFLNTSGTVTATGNIIMDGTLTTTAGGTLDMGTANILDDDGATGSFSNSGTIKTSVPTSTSATPLPVGIAWGGTIIYGATTGNQTVMDGTYNNLTLSNTSGTNTAEGDIVVNAGTMTTTAGGTLDMTGSFILSGSGTFTNNGTISTSVPSSVSTTAIPSGKTWGGKIIYAAPAGDQTIVSETAYNNLTLSNSSGTNTTLANIVVNGALVTTSGGTLDMGSFTLSGTLSSITGSGATIRTANTSTAPIKSGQTWPQTIEYYNATGGQTIVAATYTGGLINSNTSGTNTVATAATVSIPGDLTLNAGSTLSDNGVIISLAGDIQGTGTHTGSGTGAISMTASGATIAGVTLRSLTLNNAGGFSTTADVTINGTLTLTSGRLNISANTLTFGSAATVSGTPSSTKMIIANGGGQVQKKFTATGAFTFPIGDNIPNYTPLTLTFTGGSFGSGAYGGVSVTNVKHPQNANTTNYLKRYWSVATSGVTSPVYSISSTYVTGDVTGTEASMSMGQYPNALPWVKFGATNAVTHTLSATGVTAASSDFSGITTAAPTLTVTPTSVTICSGSSTTLSVSGGGDAALSYSWAPSTGLSATTGTSVTASPTTGGTASTIVYTVTITDGNGFKTTATSTVSINPVPAAITGGYSSCIGTPTTFSDATSGGTWSSSNTAVGTIGSTTGILNGLTAGATIVTYRLPTGCIDTNSVTVNNAPSPITGTLVFCQNLTTTLSDLSGGVWSSGNTGVATVGSSSGIVSGVSNGNAVITFTGGVGCFVTATVTVNPIQPISGVYSSCVGSTTVLTDATAGGTWSSSNTAVGTVGSTTGIVYGVSVGTTAITYLLPTGCKDTNVIAINAVPSAITGTMNVCVGSTTSLVNSGGTWSSSDITKATIGSASGIVTGVAAGVITITFSAGSGCYVTTPFTVNALPAAITGTPLVCVGSTTTLNDATTGGTWSSSNTGFATVNSSGTVTGVGAGIPTITYTSSAGCIITQPVTVNSLPATITGTFDVCVGSTRTWTDGTAGGTWSSSNTAQATVGSSSGIVTGVAAGIPTITYTLGTGCYQTQAITVNSLPTAITGASTVCVGLTSTLGSTPAGGTWSSSDATKATVGSSSGIVTGVATGNVNITYTTTSGCITAKALTVNAAPGAITGTGTVCVGSTRTWTDAGGGTWSSSNSAQASVGSSTGIVTGVASGIPTITYTLGTGCYITKPMTVNPVPSAITGTITYCLGDSGTLSDGSSGGTWTSGDITTATIGSLSGVVAGVAPGTAIISYSFATGCKATTVVTINDVPADIDGATDTCVGATVTLSDTDPGGTWSSSNTSIATVGSSTGVVTGISAGMATITYMFSTGCYAVAGVPIDPNPTAITGNLIACVGAISTLDNGISGGTWTSSNTAKATIDTFSGDLTAVAVGTARITYELVTGCRTTSVASVTAMPSLASASNSSIICAGATLTLTANTPTNVTGYLWTGPVAITSSTSSSASVPSATTAAGGTYTVTVNNGTGAGCTASYNTVATVNPTPSAAPTNDGAICNGGTVNLTANPAGGASVYTWSGANLFSTIVANPTATPTVTSTYSLTVSNGSGRPGCSPSTVYTTTVTVNSVPTAAPTNSGPICNGGTVTLTANPAGGASVYTWSGSSLSSTTAQNPTATPTSTTIYSLTVTDGSGHSGCSPATVYTTSVTVNGAPSLASATNNGPICAGAPLSLTANTPSNVTGYSWAGPVTVTSSTSATATVPSATTAASGTYTVTVNNGSGSGCTTTYTTSATVNTTPTAAPANNGPICSGGTVSLSANPSGGATTYTWSGTALSSTTAQNPTATPTVTGTYSLTVSDGTGHPGCSPSTVYTTSVTVNSVPTAAPTNSSPICSGGSVTLTANPAGGADTYTWSGPNLSSTTVQNPTATPTVSSTYSLTVSYGTGHPGCSPSTVYTTAVTVTPGGQWLGVTSTDWNTATNWCGGIPTASTNVLVPSGTTYAPSITTGTSVAHDITIQSSASLTVNGGALQISGAISNSGTFTASNGTIEMNGSSSQSIPASAFASNTVKNLTINNSAGVSLGGALSVSEILKVTTGTFTTGGYITLLSSSSKTALVDGSGAGSISGNVSMQRYFASGFGYKYISTPFSATTVGSYSSFVGLTDTFPSFYSYDEDLASAGWVSDTTLSNSLTTLRGYAANFGGSSSATTLSLAGAVNNGSQSITLYNHNRTYTQGFNLVGNPYPSPIDWNASSGWTKTNIDNAIYYFNNGTTDRYAGTYSSYISGVSSDGVANGIIPAMQGFFVHVSTGSYPVTGTLATTNSVRVNTLTPTFHRNTSSDKPLLRFTAGFANSVQDPVVLYFDDNATSAFNSLLDAHKMMNTDASVPNLYSISQETKAQYAIQALQFPVDSSTTIIPLGLETEKDGIVTFNARDIEQMPGGMHIFFNDTKTGNVQDLRATPDYKQYIDKGKYEDRFYLMFTYREKADLPLLGNELYAYGSSGNLLIYLTSGDGSVIITNMLGQVVVKQAISGNGYHQVDCPFASSMYIVTLFSGNGKQSKKIVLGNK